MADYRKPTELKEEAFKGVIGGEEVQLIRLRNNVGVSLALINQGAKLVSLVVPDREGRPVDVLLGHDTLQDYIDSEEQYFGAICGRYANRIAKGQFTLDGKQYQLAVNNGRNALHGGVKGFNSVVWKVSQKTSNEVILSYTSPDGEEGYPGELTVHVTYTLPDNAKQLIIEYEATTTAPTVVNLTNHAYFNLSGEGDPSVHDHFLQINSQYYLPTDDTSIPNGKPEAVQGTPFDFRTAETIGLRIDEAVDQLEWARGYDHTYIIDKEEGAFGLAAICWSPKSGIRMEVHTTEPGMQVYTGNWMSGNMRGKGESRYPARSAVCFETQHYPDSPNKPEYPTTVLRPDQTLSSTTVYSFDTIEK